MFVDLQFKTMPLKPPRKGGYLPNISVDNDTKKEYLIRKNLQCILFARSFAAYFLASSLNHDTKWYYKI